MSSAVGPPALVSGVDVRFVRLDERRESIG
jgi:hypothetical protein